MVPKQFQVPIHQASFDYAQEDLLQDVGVGEGEVRYRASFSLPKIAQVLVKWNQRAHSFGQDNHVD